MTNETKPPPDLGRLQAGFGASISTPFEFSDDTGDFEVRVDAYDPFTLRQIRGRGEQSPAERLAVYNQQYWFRLLSVMQEEFPLTEALLGVQAFNRLAMSYLDAHRPDSPRLRDLSHAFTQYAQSASADPSVIDAIRLERIYVEAFDAAQLPGPSEAPSEADDDVRERLVRSPLRFQPHFHLFETRWNLVDLRRRVKRGEAVDGSDLVKDAGQFALWRGNGVQSVELGPVQWELVVRLFDGVPLERACEELAQTLDDEHVEFLATHVQRWFAAWARAGWFAL